MTIMIPAWIDGTLTPVEKLEVHQKGLRHKAVSVFVIKGPNILLQRRAMGKYHTPGLWANTCCTHPDWQEDPAHCAERRLAEELGITGLPLSFRQDLEYRADVGNGLIEHEVVDVFVAQAPSDLSIVPNPDEVMDTRWVHFRDLKHDIDWHPERYTPWVRLYLQEHTNVIFGAEFGRGFEHA